MKTIYVRFKKDLNLSYNQAYAFKYDGDEDLVRGDAVVVDSVNGLGVAYVDTVHDKAYASATKFVLCRVPVEEHLRRIQRDAERKVLQAKLDKKIKEFESQRVVQLLVQEDSEAAQLVKQLEILNG